MRRSVDKNSSSLLRAAELLESAAAALLEANTIEGGDWRGAVESKASHDEMLRVAAELRTIAAELKPEIPNMLPDWDPD